MRSQTEANAMDDFPFSIFCARIFVYFCCFVGGVVVFIRRYFFFLCTLPNRRDFFSRVSKENKLSTFFVRHDLVLVEQLLIFFSFMPVDNSYTHIYSIFFCCCLLLSFFFRLGFFFVIKFSFHLNFKQLEKILRQK